MEEFDQKNIEDFLRSVDRHISRPIGVIIIGGAAAIISFKTRMRTGDIDFVSNIAMIADAIQSAREETGLQIPAGTVGVWDGPYEYESRLEYVNVPELKNLKVFTPEKHDWALMKIVRLLGKDVDDIKEVSEASPFDKDVFLDRFVNEMTHVIGRREDLIYNFLSMMSELFGEDEASRMERVIKSHKEWK